MVDERISEEEKGELTKDISKEEIKAALIQMNPLKATGLDGFNVFFFQRYWDVVKNEVCNCVFNFFKRGEMPSTLNHTNIILIPKMKGPFTPMDYRPISLCNVAYKIIVKSLSTA